MKRFGMLAGAFLLIAMMATESSIATEQRAKEQAAVRVSPDGAHVSDVTYRPYARTYRYNTHYGPRYYDGYHDGPRYRTNHYYGPRYRGGYHYGPSYYRGPAGAVNVYPGGVDVGRLHIGW